MFMVTSCLIHVHWRKRVYNISSKGERRTFNGGGHLVDVGHLTGGGTFGRRRTFNGGGHFVRGNYNHKILIPVDVECYNPLSLIPNP